MSVWWFTLILTHVLRIYILKLIKTPLQSGWSCCLKQWKIVCHITKRVESSWRHASFYFNYLKPSLLFVSAFYLTLLPFCVELFFLVKNSTVSHNRRFVYSLQSFPLKCTMWVNVNLTLPLNPLTNPQLLDVKWNLCEHCQKTKSLKACFLAFNLE